MKKVYILHTNIYNGSILIKSIEDIFSDKDIAEKTLQVLENSKDSTDFDVIRSIEEAILYETEKDVPILNKK